ncbi:hypothetical protein NOM73_06290 [Erwinia persicina]|uniref:hypothetical protein n=1 Tax=Erwinia persicina TaxID=55211 RepID=UPI002109F83E|nr:hypothetical protein [Erwinia persicina]MCQ4095004.1 hypothetical protein [Erwinia persicina]MCQ4100031.1 hypothetical protein [Erwinia persicina]
MADYKVKAFLVQRKMINEGKTEAIILTASLINSAGNPKEISYWLTDDTRATLEQIETILNAGFGYAKANSAKVGISEFLERTYIFFTLPSATGKTNHQFTGDKF